MIDDVEFIMYSRSDSSMSWLGQKVVRLIQSFVGDSPVESVALAATGETEKRIADFVSTFVGKEKSLDDIGGNFDLDAMLSLSALKAYCGVINLADTDWLADSLFCEWGYRVDFTNRELEVYTGGITDKKWLRGRYADLLPVNNEGLRETYWPISLVASASFDEPYLFDHLMSQIQESK